jgi:5-methylcytosine-specific restriction endonuclease McrA
MPWTPDQSGHPRGRAWERFRRLVFATHGTTCILCLHGGARTVDHLLSISERPDLAWSLGNCRPIHAAPHNRCPVCGQNCNGIKGGYSLERARRRYAEKMAAAGKSPSPPRPEKPADSGREW